MRLVFHRLLSGAPALAAAYIAILVTAFPLKAAEHFSTIQVHLMSDERSFWLCIVLITVYAVLWWATAGAPRSHRQKIQQGLRPHYKEMTALLYEMRTAATDEEWQGVQKKHDSVLQKCAQWIMDNMGEAAFTKINHPTTESLVWSWAGEHDKELKTLRGQYLTLQAARVKVLDIFLSNDGWDGPGLTLRRRARRKWLVWKAKRGTASTRP